MRTAFLSEADGVFVSVVGSIQNAVNPFASVGFAGMQHTCMTCCRHAADVPVTWNQHAADMLLTRADMLHVSSMSMLLTCCQNAAKMFQE